MSKEKKIKLPNQVQFILTDEEMKNGMVEIMTRFNMVKRDKIYQNIFKKGLKQMLIDLDKLTLQDFE